MSWKCFPPTAVFNNSQGSFGRCRYVDLRLQEGKEARQGPASIVEAYISAHPAPLLTQAFA